jgi:outer membrane murein-binding lipoprotein Lpp
MFKIYLIVAFVGAIAGGYSYHQVTVSKFEAGIAKLESNNRTLKENQVQLDIAINTAEASLKAAEENAKKSEAAMNALTSRNQELNREKQTYLKIFKDHNLTRLARARPGMIEKRINNGTQKVFEALENDTKELMDVDDTNADGVQSDATSGVGTGTDSGSTGTTDSNGS